MTTTPDNRGSPADGPMSEDARGRIAEIEARANAATEGPWEAEDTARGAWIRGSNGHWAALACGESDKEAIKNRDFLKNARADIPWLLEQLRTAQAEIERSRETLNKSLERSVRLTDMDNKVRAALCNCKSPDDHEDNCWALAPIRAIARLRAVVDAARNIISLNPDGSVPHFVMGGHRRAKLRDAIAARDAAEGDGT